MGCHGELFCRHDHQGNALFAANGAQMGYRKTIPFLLGFDTANLVMSLMYGFGVGKILEQNQVLHQTLKIVGTIYMLYLAYTFLKSKSMADQQEKKYMRYRDGFVVVFLHPKIHAMYPILYSQFILSSKPLFPQVMTITAVFVFLCLVSIRSGFSEAISSSVNSDPRKSSEPKISLSA